MLKNLLGGLLVSSLLVSFSSLSMAEMHPKYDLVLTNGTIVDGTGSAQFDGDIGIKDGRILAIGDLASEASSKNLDIQGYVVAPGFIDTHSHADRAFGSPETAGIPGFLMQGVTTAVYGVDGGVSLDDLQRYIALSDSGGMGINFMSYIGHNGVRQAVMGMDGRPPSDAELEQMKTMVRQAMELGATGLSTGLMYLPGSYATTEEVIELAKVTAPYNASYDSHIRDPAKNLLASHQECLDIAFAAGVDAHPGHVKAVGGKNFGKGPDLVKLMEAGIARGQNVTVDLYPYDGAATTPVIMLLYPANDELGQELMRRMMAIMSGEASQDEILASTAEFITYWREFGDNPDLLKQARANTETPPEGVFSWVNVVGYQSMRIVVSGQDGYEGRMVTDLAAELDIPPFELYRQIVVAEGATAMVTLGAIPEEDIRIIMKQPWAMISSDGEELEPSHPRGRGTFPRVLGRYVREWGVLTLEEAVHKISGLPAQYLKMSDRGVIRNGAVADLVVFNPDTVIDKATWSEPTLYAEGIRHVLIGGEFALQDGAPTDQRLGRFIRFTGKESQRE
jgi:N-acyl-D-amino-acid deacylase